MLFDGTSLSLVGHDLFFSTRTIVRGDRISFKPKQLEKFAYSSGIVLVSHEIIGVFLSDIESLWNTNELEVLNASERKIFYTLQCCVLQAPSPTN